MKQRCWRGFIGLLLCWHTMVWATIVTKVEPVTVALGATFRVTFTTEDDKVTGMPDLTPFEQDFTIVGTERQTVYSVVNGQAHLVHEWSVLLSAKRAGVLTLPSIRIGHEQSAPSRIEVTKASLVNDKPKDMSRDGLLLKATVDKKTVLVNQQLVYTVKLFNSRQLMDAEYQPPQVENALMMPLGEERHYQTTLQGQRYVVDEQKYAIFPQKSGPLTIHPPEFQAIILDAVPRRVRVQGKTKAITVTPIPASFSGKQWFPAEQVALTEVYSDNNDHFTEGSTLVRTVTLQAAGLIGQLLPTWQFPEPTGFNSYPEKAVVDNTVRQQALFGRSDIKVTYLLNKVGRITLPAYSIPWFNTLMGKEERVSLPARTIEVLPRKGAAHPSTAVLHPPMVKLSNPSMLGHRWGWWMAAGFALAWALMLLGWWLFKSFIHRRREKSLAWKHLRQACAKHKPLEAQAALLRWASLQWPSFKGVTLDQLARKMNDASVQEALTDLSKVLYGTSNPTPWQGDFLWQSLTVYLRKKPTPRVHADDLPPINPQQ